LKDKLQNKIEAYESMKKKKDEDNENFTRERSDLNKKSENQNKLREDLEKRCKKLIEEKNNILMFNSSAQNLSENEVKFRELINNIIDPDLSILSLNQNNLEDIHIKYLSQCNFLKGLTSLDLQNNSLLTLEGFKTLEQCGFNNTLTEFKLKWTIKGLEGLQYLKDCIFLKKLTVLDLSSLELKDEGLKLFSKCDYLRNLTSLNLSNNQITDIGFDSLITSSFLSNLSRLNVSKNNLKNIKFNNYKYLVNLTHVDLSDNNIIPIITLGDIFQEIKSLNLSRNTNLVLFENSEEIKLHKLSTLDLSGCDIKIKGLKNLLKNDIFNSLLEVNLSRNELGNDCVYELSQIKNLVKLESLDLSFNEIEARGLEKLDKCAFKSLSKLNLSNNQLKNDGVEILSKCVFNS